MKQQAFHIKSSDTLIPEAPGAGWGGDRSFSTPTLMSAKHTIPCIQPLFCMDGMVVRLPFGTLMWVQFPPMALFLPTIESDVNV